MAEPYCERTDLPVSMCAHCKGVSDVDIENPKSRAWPEPSFGDLTQVKVIARFEAHCPSCLRLIELGHTIYRTTEGHWLCELCADSQED